MESWRRPIIYQSVIFVVALLTAAPGVAGAQERAMPAEDASGEDGSAATAQPAAEATADAPTATGTPAVGEDPRIIALRRELFEHERMELVGSVPLKGKVKLRGSAFAAALDRPDLVTAYRQRKAAKIVAMVLGGVSTGVGVVWGIGSAAGAAVQNSSRDFGCFVTNTSQEPSCQQRDEANGFGWGLAMMGSAALIGGIVTSSDPLTLEEKQTLVAEHNKQLWARISVSPLPAAGGAAGGGLMRATIPF
jgi:hypothetical protein